MPTIWFIRHAESKSNIGLPASCPKTVGITERGIRQAEKIAAFFDKSPSLFVISKYTRAQETATPTIHRFPGTRRKEWDVHEFTYLSPCKGPCRTVQERRPKVNKYWERCDPFYHHGEEAESFADFMSRVWRVLEQLRYSQEDFIAVFSHGQFIQATLWLLCNPPTSLDGKSMRYFKSLLEAYSVPNGAIVPVRLWGKEGARVGEIITSHLP